MLKEKSLKVMALVIQDIGYPKESCFVRFKIRVNND